MSEPGTDTDATAGKGRLEAFSDGVIAILITIMVLELKVPDALAHGFDRAALAEFGPKFGAYGLSFLVLAIMWVNHHAMTRDLKRLAPGFTWLNMILLFAMSMIPLVTEFYGAHPNSTNAAAAYGAVLATTAWSYVGMRAWLQRHETDPAKRSAHRGIQLKNLLGASLYTLSIALAFINPHAPLAIFLLVPAMFFTPNMLLPKALRSS
ncbi:MAG TPA: TMEM175 family protein [Caulobacteraceae bacterium]|nr:TMEM175 family protein [Caulobacteraceae bacterium]